MKILYSPASLDDLISSLRAWRIWIFSAIIGCLVGAAVYQLAPPPYRSQATANIDFNLEMAWPKYTDRQQFYYLERETRKLEEIAWSDAVLKSVAAADGNTLIGELRNHKLQLSQPAEGGWHFFADDPDPKRAQLLASSWVQAFVEQAGGRIIKSEGLNSYIEIEATQIADLPQKRSLPLGSYLFAGLMAGWIASFFLSLFVRFVPTPEATLQGKKNGSRRKPVKP